MSNSQRDPGLEPALRDVESIQSLDTARLALRWALERMRALEKHSKEAEEAQKRAEAAQTKAASELEGARDLLTRRSGEALERERYYSKIEEYLNLKLGGGLDAAALAKRESRVDEREAELQRREIENENRIRLAERRAEEEIRKAHAESAASADVKIRQTRDEYELRASARDQDLASRLLTLHEREVQLTTLERTLEERRKRFDEFFAAQREALEREASSITQAATDQAGFLEKRIEQSVASKTAVLERAWQADKQTLLEELAAWRGKAREHLPAMLEAQRKAASLDDENRRLMDDNTLLLQVKETLTDEVVRWRTQVQNDLPSLLETVRRAAEAEEATKKLEIQLAQERRRAEEAQAQLMADELSREGRLQELTRLEGALAARLRDAEKDLFRQYDSWLAREGDLRRRDESWRIESQARNQTIEALREEITSQRAELTRAIASYRVKINALAEGDAQNKGDAK
jgi:hypothetical protein